LEKNAANNANTSKTYFWVFHCYFSIFFNQKLDKKTGSNRCPLFTMLMKQNLINVLHNKLVKKKCHPSLLSDSLIQKHCVLKENDLIIMGDLPFLKFKTGLFSRITCLHTLTLFYFHKQPVHFEIQTLDYFYRWPALLWNLKTDLFSWATCLF